MNNEIGICLWTFGDLTLQEKLEISKNLGVDGVELEGDLSVSPRLVKELLNKYDLKALSITPENRDIIMADEVERGKNINYFLQLVDWAAEIGVPRLTLHGKVGVIESDDYKRDDEYLINATRTIVRYAKSKNIEIVFEVLNRYESFQIRTGEEALALLDVIKEDNFKVLLDAYHMNIEEVNPSEAIRKVGKDLAVYHVADNNRLGLGSGHINFAAQFEALKEINYQGPIIMELSASGPNPFTPVKEEGYIKELTEEYAKSIDFIRKG